MGHGCDVLVVVVVVAGLAAGRPAGGRSWVRIQQDTCRRATSPAAGCSGRFLGNTPPGAARGVTGVLQRCCVLAQYKPQIARRLAGLALTLLLALAPPLAAAACRGLAQPLVALGPGLWWLPAVAGDSQAGNRGRVSNLLLLREGPGRGARWWLLGSGPSPAFGRALACQLQRQLGARVTDVISPWARPELVLGVAGLQAASGAPIRHWAHAEVAQAMAVQCPHCVERLALRLGPAAADLGADPIRLPGLRLQGDQGRLGPFDWWTLPRSAGRVVTVWRLAQPGRPALWLAPGLLQGEGGVGPPDGRDADLALLAQSAQRLAALAAADGPAARFIGEQGPPLPADAPLQHARYWTDLLAQARAAVERGDDETAPPPAWPGLPAGWAQAPWHALNWQRAWRQVEAEVLAAPVPAPSPAASAP